MEILTRLPKLVRAIRRDFGLYCCITEHYHPRRDGEEVTMAQVYVGTQPGVTFQGSTHPSPTNDHETSLEEMSSAICDFIADRRRQQKQEAA